jgi:hypothetical protein
LQANLDGDFAELVEFDRVDCGIAHWGKAFFSLSVGRRLPAEKLRRHPGRNRKIC